MRSTHSCLLVTAALILALVAGFIVTEARRGKSLQAARLSRCETVNVAEAQTRECMLRSELQAPRERQVGF